MTILAFVLACSSPSAPEVIEEAPPDLPLPPPEAGGRDPAREAMRLAVDLASKQAARSTCVLPEHTNLELRLDVAGGKATELVVADVSSLETPRTDELATCLIAEARAWAFPPGLEVDGVKLGIQR